jgi:hypothetical protein
MPLPPTATRLASNRLFTRYSKAGIFYRMPAFFMFFSLLSEGHRKRSFRRCS